MARNAPRTLVVSSSFRLTPNMQRIVFAGEDLSDFPHGYESGYLKLVFSGNVQLGEKPRILRTYTIRKFDAVTNELTIDFAIHDHTEGPASAWAKKTKPGDRLQVQGPGPTKLVDNSADWFLLVGDMTSLPAIACNLEQMPTEAKGYAVIEITSEEDKQEITKPDGVEVTWVINPEPHIHKEDLVSTVKSIEWKSGIPAVWAACEFNSMRKLRSNFTDERKVAKENIYISSYWKIDSSEEQHRKHKFLDQEKQLTLARRTIRRMFRSDFVHRVKTKLGA